VALTRAKHGLFVVGNAWNLQKIPIWRKLIKICEKRGKYFNDWKEAKEYIVLKRYVEARKPHNQD